MNQRVIVLRGVPGSGKSTIAKSYRNLQSKFVWLKVDNFKDFFAEDSSEALEYVNGAAVVTLEYLLENGFSVVMDGVFQDTSSIDKAEEVASKLNVPVRVFELKASLETLVHRDKSREGVREKLRPQLGDKTIRNIFQVLKDNPYKKAINLDTEKNSVVECRKIIEESFN